MSIGPRRAETSSTIALTESSSLTSATTAIPPTSAATASQPSASRSTTATCAPAAASARHEAAPMPLAPPVTMATVPFSSMTQPPRASAPLLGAAIGWEDRIDHVFDHTVTEKHRDAFHECHRTKREGRQPERMHHSEIGVGEHLERHVQTLHHLALILRGLRAHAEHGGTEFVSTRDSDRGIRTSAACNRERPVSRPTRAAGPGRPRRYADTCTPLSIREGSRAPRRGRSWREARGPGTRIPGR